MQDTTENYIHLEKVSKIYGTKEVKIIAVDEISFNIAKGEFAVIVGPSGAGKTTVLNIVKKRLQESENILIIDDFDPWNYEDEAALLSGILDTIFKHSQVDYSVSKLRKWKRDLLAIDF